MTSILLGVDRPSASSSVYFDRRQTVTENSKTGGVQSDLCAAVIAMIGHDLRQPLQVITSSHGLLATMLRRRAQPDELARAENATAELATMLGQLVELLSLQSGFAAPGDEPVVLRPLFARLAVEFTRPAALKGIELRIAPASGVVSSHPTLLRAILRNLIRNAIDYTPSGGRVLVASRRRGARMHLEVRDSGPGIAPGELSKIFEAFYRADTSRADGLGLGLFIVGCAAQFLGHQVEVRSTVGRGSCFAVVADRPFAERDIGRMQQETTTAQSAKENVVAEPHTAEGEVR
ncbi:MAG TPA: HAMP domain-containing sensor histidine kinase [Stellaceae bacterium]|nr:HAMP domain-containing sensor histidine kinase [Stellaceae bacterium]